VRTAGRELVLEVVDGGHGVPPEAVDRIFDRFSRADDARNRAAGGAGLGLAIVDAIARAHGGSCTVKPLPRGVLFALRLPGFEVERRSLADLAPAQTLS
jgi:two-component system OmpR family sensor kinase